MNLTGKPMVNRYEQVQLFSEAEFARRMDCVRSVMEKKQVQKLVFLECAVEAYDEWLMGRRFLEYMIVPAEGEAIGVLWDEFDERTCPPAADGTVDFGRYLLQQPEEPVNEGIRFVNFRSDTEVANYIAEGKPERIGLVLPAYLSAELADALERLLPRTELVDVSLEVALARAVKSPEEVEAARNAAKIQHLIYDALPQIIRVGRNMRDIETEVQHLAMSLGAAGVVHCHVINCGPQDKPYSDFHDYDDRDVQYKDRFFALMESAGPGHQHAAFGRHMVLGEPTEDFARTVEFGTRIHKFAVSLMKPGTTLRKIAGETAAFAAEHGYELKQEHGWNWMHSMGGYYYEQYSLEDYTDEVPLLPNIILHCHPLCYRRFPELGPDSREEFFVLNTYLVTEDGALDLCEVPFELEVLY